jgi:hypothetical protein
VNAKPKKGEKVVWKPKKVNEALKIEKKWFCD